MDIKETLLHIISMSQNITAMTNEPMVQKGCAL